MQSPQYIPSWPKLALRERKNKMCPETIVKSCRPLSFAFLDAIFTSLSILQVLSKVFLTNRYISYEHWDFTAYLCLPLLDLSLVVPMSSLLKDPEILVWF